VLLVVSGTSAANVSRRVALNVRIYGSGTLTVTGSHAFTCHSNQTKPGGTVCYHTFYVRRGRRTVVKALLLSGWRLIKWGGACKGTSNKCVLRPMAQKTTVTVRTVLRRPRIAVINSNLTEEIPPLNVCYKCGSIISYGIVLLNRSKSADARDVGIGINFIGTNGKVVTSDEQYLPGGIPAGTKFYLGGQVGVEPLSPDVTNLTVRIIEDHSSPPSLVEPAVSNIQLSTNPTDNSMIINAEVTNETTSELSKHAEVSAVVFNSAGSMVGGGDTYLKDALPPGGQTTVAIDTLPWSIFSVDGYRAKVSVDPDYAAP
jgi:hypothetical protein